jgi:hydrogenase small subunit
LKISRRDFLKWSIAAGISIKIGSDFVKDNVLEAAESDPPIIWLQGSGCTGCTISTLNVVSPVTIDNVLTSKVSMKYNNSITAAAGSTAMKILDDSATNYKGSFILVIEGAIPSGSNANYCTIGNLNGTELTMLDAVTKYGPMARYVVAAGTCAAYGGISAAAPNQASCSTVNSLLSGKTTNSVINLPGCPVHPTVLIETIVNLILSGFPSIDSNNCPTKYYSTSVHSTCPRRSASKSPIGSVGCYRDYGCKGPSTKFGSCPSLKWNNGNGLCMTSNISCIGCASSSFPTSPLISG